MKSTLVILSSHPSSVTYEQGIEVALNLADAECDVKVFISGECAKALSSGDFFKKDEGRKLMQLELYDIKTFCADKVSKADCFIKEGSLKEALYEADNTVNF